MILHAHFVLAFNDDISLEILRTKNNWYVAGDISAVMNNWGFSANRIISIDDGFEDFVLNNNRLCCALCCFGVVGSHDGNCLAVVFDGVECKYRLIDNFKAEQLGAGHIIVCKNRRDAIDLERRCDVDGFDTCVRVGRTQSRSPEHAICPQIT